jgi:uncharacterized protein YpmS
MQNLFPYMVLAIPILGIIAGMVHRLIRLREKQLEIHAGQTAEKAAQYAAHTERLEQRMRVLERIVTDRGIDVAAEIEHLRDRPLN